MCRTEAASYQLRGLQGITLLVSVLMAGAVVPHSRALAANKTISDGVYSEAQGKEGEELYLLHCAECHGDRLRGLEYAPALRGADFLRIWNNKPLSEFVAKIQETMPQQLPGSLSRKQVVDIVSYWA